MLILQHFERVLYGFRNRKTLYFMAEPVTSCNRFAVSIVRMTSILLSGDKYGQIDMIVFRAWQSSGDNSDIAPLFALLGFSK